jgi:dTDP-4-dehydrorhamnose 3,5-epimerase
MKIEKTDLEGVLLIELKIYHDERGFFVEKYHQKIFKELGLDIDFKQDNHSRSLPNVLRGLHYQAHPHQGKLIGVSRGKIFDVAVDLREDSKTYGKYFGVELSDSNGKLLWIPSGFAHGFCNIGEEEADVCYKVDDYYSPAAENGIKWDDKDINIKWPVSNPIVSKKDQILPIFAQYRLNPIKW